MNKGSSIVLALITGVGGFMLGHSLGGPRSSDTTEEQVVAIAPEGAAAGAAAPAAEGPQRVQVPVTAAEPSKGPADALVTIVEFSEFQCPFCSRVLPTTQRIFQEYPGKVRIVWRNQPLRFHANAPAAAEAAMEAFAQGGSDKFWQLHDLLFANQQTLERANLEQYAQQVGLDMTRFRAALDNHTHQAKVEEDAALAGRVGNRGTPGFFINGRFVRGAQPFEVFKQIIDEELRTAEAMVAAGTARNQVYATLLRNAPTTQTPPTEQPAAGQQRQPDPAAVYRVPLTGQDPQSGPNDALVTIVEFSDFQCPFCSRVEPTIAQLRQRYGNDLRVVWMNNPLAFHANAGPAAQLAMEAFQQGGNAKFWQAHELIFANQRTLERANLEQYAQQLGLNMAQVRAALDNNEHQGAITRAQQLATSLGATGTPTFFINGRNLFGAKPIEEFTRVIDEELAKARQLVASGTPRARVYEATIANGATAPQYVGGAPAAAAAAQPAPDPNRVYDVPVPRNAPSRGPANARVTIQLFSDYQCPFCGRIEPTLSQILQDPEFANDVRVVWRDMPLIQIHPRAMMAAQAAREVHRQGGNDKFWAYHDVLFQNQGALTRPDLERYAEQLGGINMAQFRQALDTERHKAVVEADMRAFEGSGAQTTTPTAFVNGRILVGNQPVQAFQGYVRNALRAPQ